MALHTAADTGEQSTMPTITIRHRWTDAVLYSHETTDERQASGLAMRDALEAAVKSNADLSKANLFGADLSGADLSGADLSGADLSRATLFGADLSRAELSRAELSRADLSEADLSEADLSGADLSGANLSKAKVRNLTLTGPRPFLAIGPIGSESRTVFAWLTESGLRIQAGCFFGNRDEFTAQLSKTHGDNEHAQEYTAALVLIDAHAKLWAPAAVPVAA